MFTYAYTFNSPINDWDVSNVTEMGGMFQLAVSFDQPLNGWDVSNVTDMVYMFAQTSSFDRPLGSWSLNSEIDTMGMFENSGMSVANYDATLTGWVTSNDVRSGVSFGARDLRYCNAANARTALIEE